MNYLNYNNSQLIYLVNIYKFNEKLMLILFA